MIMNQGKFDLSPSKVHLPRALVVLPLLVNQFYCQELTTTWLHTMVCLYVHVP